MYKELESKVFILKNYNNRDEMEQYIKEYVKMLKREKTKNQERKK